MAFELAGSHESACRLLADYRPGTAGLEAEAVNAGFLSANGGLFALDRQILQNNLCGVDLNEEAIQICQIRTTPLLTMCAEP